jgi:hypothetical protein
VAAPQMERRPVEHVSASPPTTNARGL